jgi:hypothetical protein
MSEADNVWRVTVDGKEHEVELVHGSLSGDRTIKLDGEVIEKDRKFFDTGTTHDFEIAGHPAQMKIGVKYSGLAHQSSLHVDDAYVEPLTQ